MAGYPPIPAPTFTRMVNGPAAPAFNSDAQRAFADWPNQWQVALEKLLAKSAGPLVFNPIEYGAYCDLSHDDSTALTNCLADAKGKGIVEVPYPGMLITDVTVPQSTYMRAAPFMQNAPTTGYGVQLVGGDSTKPVLHLTETTQAQINANVFNFQSSRIEGFLINGGRDSIYAPCGALALELRDLICYQPIRAGIFAEEFCQQWICHNIEVAGGQYGFSFTDSGRLNSIPDVDKSSFYDCYLHGQSVNGIYAKLPQSNDVGWYSVVVQGAGHDGIYLGGGLRRWSFYQPSFEANGHQTYIAPTTGTIVAGSSSLVVASATGITVGKILTIHGAGPSGTDLYAYAHTVSGTTITLWDVLNTGPTTASTNVTDAEVTTAQWCDIKTDVSGGAFPAEVLVINAQTGTEEPPGSQLRYGMDLSTGVQHTVIGGTWGRPLYIGGGQVSVWTSEVSGNLYIRRASNHGDVISGTLTGATTSQLESLLRQLLTSMDKKGAISNATT